MARPTARKPIHLRPGEGRAYDGGPVTAIFKADGRETAGRYSISEWWLEPKTKGPGAHSHEEDDVFFVLQGTMTFRIGDQWIEAKEGSFVLAPGGVTHDFENRTGRRAGMLNVSAPGNFEKEMSGIAEWFRTRAPKDARTEPRPRKIVARARGEGPNETPRPRSRRARRASSAPSTRQVCRDAS